MCFLAKGSADQRDELYKETPNMIVNLSTVYFWVMRVTAIFSGVNRVEEVSEGSVFVCSLDICLQNNTCHSFSFKK